jgi:hypothetical protein
MYPESDPGGTETYGSPDPQHWFYLYPLFLKHYCPLNLAFSVDLKRVSVSSFGLFLFLFDVPTTCMEAFRLLPYSKIRSCSHVLKTALGFLANFTIVILAGNALR